MTLACEICHHNQHEKDKCTHSNPYGRCDCGHKYSECYNCEGRGELVNDPEWDGMTHECTNCGGTGEV